MTNQGIPIVMLDAGGEPWDRVNHLIQRRMDEMLDGTVLELVSHLNAIHLPLQLWCATAGHELQTTTLDSQRTAFRITKR